MLNQPLFEHVYLVSHEDTSQLTATATCLPPFDSILGWGGSPTDNEQTLLEGEESMKPLTTDPGERDEEQAATPATAASGQPHTPQPPGAAQTLPVPRGHEVAGGHEVANTRPGTQPPNRQSCLKPPKTVQNKPCSTQKPTPEVSQDVGLSVEHLVGATLSHSNLWKACWRYVMQHAAQEGSGGSPGHAADAESLDGGGVAVPAPRRMNRYLRPELVGEMAELYQAGCTVKELAQQFGFHRQTVARHLKRVGLTLRTDIADESFRQRVRQAYAAVGTIKGTARQLGVSRSTVQKVVRGG
mgnify:FL=1